MKLPLAYITWGVVGAVIATGLQGDGSSLGPTAGNA